MKLAVTALKPALKLAVTALKPVVTTALQQQHQQHHQYRSIEARALKKHKGIQVIQANIFLLM